MKTKIFKKIIFILIVSITISIIPNVDAYAKNVIDEQVKLIKERNEYYRQILESEYSFEDGQPAQYFGLMDVNGDGIEELSANTNDIADYKYPSNLISYANGKIYYMANMWTMGGVYYCPSTNNFMVCGSIDLETMSMSEYGVDIWICDGKPNDAYYGGFETLYESSYSNEFKSFFHYEDVTQEDIINQNIPENEIGKYYDEQGNITGYFRIVKDSKEQVMSEIDSLMPTKILVESPYKNTVENRDKYLPTDEAIIRAMLEEKNKENTKEENNGNSTTNNNPSSNEKVDSGSNNNGDSVSNGNTTEDVIDKIVSNSDDRIFIDNIKASLYNGVTLESYVIDNKEVVSSLEKSVKKVVPEWINCVYYELNLKDANKSDLEQLDGNVMVHISLSFTPEEKNIVKVFRIEDNSLIECKASVKDNVVSFETNHFSSYVILEISEETALKTSETSTDNSINNENTTSWIVIIIIAIVVSITVIVGKVFYNKNYFKKEEHNDEEL